MPELPEVEIIKIELLSSIVNKKINFIWNSNKKFRVDFPNFDILLEQNIFTVHRKNKYLIVETNYNYIIFHLGMSGRLIYNNNIPDQKHIHFYLKFDSGFLYFQDARRFGNIYLYDKTSFKNHNEISLFSNFGVEPLSNNLTLDYLQKKLSTNKSIKSFLMDSKYVCGIGNIYASEILFLSKINPIRKCKSLSVDEIKLLLFSIKNILTLAIENGGSSISDFVHTNGSKGDMQNFYNVYGKKNCFCKCGNKIIKIIQNSRSTFFCSLCQK